MASNKVLMLDRNFLVSILLSISCSLINSCKNVLCQHIYPSIWWVVYTGPFDGFLCNTLTLVLFLSDRYINSM